MLLGEAMVVGMELIVGLVASLTSYSSTSSSIIVRKTRLDRLLIGSFSMFSFIACFFEPYVVHLCGWDPIFLSLPLWMRITCSLDTLLFGPFYVTSLYAFASGQQESQWYRTVALPMSGALIYSRIVYFAYEVLAEADRARLGWVFVINLPWTLAPFLVIHRVGVMPLTEESKTSSKTAVESRLKQT